MSSSAPSSPKNNRVKFLCSHGGKILPRPADAHLKYVGGETRVISVPRDINFQELMEKLTYLIDGQMILKYQVVSEDLDALVSVKSDEDVRHMFDEIDHYENTGAPRLRTFLFPANPLVMENQVGNVDPQALEQGYIDAINGIVRSKQYPTINTNMQHGSFLSSGCSSPRSPDSCTTTEAMNNETNNYQSTRLNVHRVQSSPSIVPQYYRQPPHQSSYQSPKLPIDAHKSVVPERLISVRSVGRVEGARYQVDAAPQYYSSTSRQNRGSGICTKCMNYEGFSHCLDRRMIDRTGSLGTSPVPSSPLNGHCGMKPWDTTLGGDI